MKDQYDSTAVLWPICMAQSLTSDALRTAGEISAPKTSDAVNDGTKNLSAQGASSLRPWAVIYPQHSEPQDPSASQNIYLGFYILIDN